MAMKQTLSFLFALFLLSGCGSKTARPVANEESVAQTTKRPTPQNDQTTNPPNDQTEDTFADLLSKATWVNTEYGFKFPNCMTPSSEIWVDEVPAFLYRWNYEDVCLACWPLLGTWAVIEYPETGSYLTEDVHVKNITYQNGDDTVFSGYATDGRIWYMKKKLTKGGEVTHAKILVLLYPKAMQSDVTKLIEIVKGW